MEQQLKDQFQEIKTELAGIKYEIKKIYDLVAEVGNVNAQNFFTLQERLNKRFDEIKEMIVKNNDK
ncbi:MAG TPA: hypothetical protein VHD35_09305 [Chitinophagaceae bacterium]|jgi:hypothetical protein|nr:hypothetical protein [Chitinophagaceae bacterium]